MGPTILVVDDDRDYLELVKGRLTAAGFPSVDVLDDPRSRGRPVRLAGDRRCRADRPVGMPEMDGQALLELIKRQSPATECIMVTAMNDARTAVQCLRQGAYDYLVKPVAEDDLVFSVKRALERKRLVDILQLGTQSPPARLRPPRSLPGDRHPLPGAAARCSRRPSCTPPATSRSWSPARAGPARNCWRGPSTSRAPAAPAPSCP